jgi:superoxide oxidase
LQLPALIDESKSIAELIQEFHETVGTLGYFLIGLLSLAALYHHCLLRDNTLRRILPKSCDSRTDLQKIAASAMVNGLVGY